MSIATKHVRRFDLRYNGKNDSELVCHDDGDLYYADEVEPIIERLESYIASADNAIQSHLSTIKTVVDENNQLRGEQNVLQSKIAEYGDEIESLELKNKRQLRIIGGLSAALALPDDITTEPSNDYESLKKQFYALRSFANSKCRMADYWREQVDAFNREAIAANQSVLSSEHEANQILTNENEHLRQQLADIAKSAQKYRNSYLLDEVEDPDVCMDVKHHEDCKEFSAAIDAALQQSGEVK